MEWRRLLSRRPNDAEIDEEIRAHLEMAIQDRIDRGESPREARRSALLELGNATAVKEDTRTVWVWRALETLGQDLRYALRQIRNRPGFTALAVLTLAFGLSVNATVFSLISSLFLRPLPVKDAERLVVVLRQRADHELLGGMSWSDYQDYRSGIAEFSDALALSFRPAHLSVDGRAADRTWIEAVSGNYFSMLGVTPLTGRLFLPGEGERPGADPIAVLSYDYWRTRLGGDPGIVGRAVVINGRPFTVIGVAPESFSSAQWSIAPSAFVPATMTPVLYPGSRNVLETRDSGAFKVMAHLGPGVSEAQATSAVQVLAARLDQEHRPDDAATRVFVRPERLTRPEPSFSGFVPFAALVFTVMGVLVLFIACANVANLMFSRAVTRQREVVIRSAIGAHRRRLIRQLLTESVLLAVIAGAAGTLLSFVTGILLTRFSAMTGDIPVSPDESWDWLPILCTMLISVAAGVATGLFPALRATRVDLLSILKGAGGGNRSERSLFRSGLVLGQIAVSVVVLACGGLFVHSLQKLADIDLGLRADRLMMASVDLGLQGYEQDQGRRFLDELVERAEALPGVESAAIGTNVPFDTYMTTRVVVSAGDVGASEHEESGAELRAGVNRIDPGYLGALA